MDTRRLLILLFLFPVLLSAQITFEKGYIIDKNGVKQNCLIKNVDWANNPSRVVYKKSKRSSTKTATANDIKGFGIVGKIAFLSFTVSIDKTSQEPRQLSYFSKPEFVTETLFLSTLVEDSVDLFAYEQGNLDVFFFRKGNDIPQQLVYKKYKNKEEYIRVNSAFRLQLLEHLTDDQTTFADVQKLKYTKEALTSYFIKYNEGRGSTPEVYAFKKKQDLINLNIRPGFYASQMLLKGRETDVELLDFGISSAFRMGLELEFILPFNSNKWGIFVEPTYRSYEAEGERNSENILVDYHSLEIPVGVRHYFFLSQKTKVFFNASYSIDLEFDSVMDFEVSQDLTIASLENFAVGAGLKYNDRLGFEIRYGFEREITPRAINIKTEYTSLSFILSYTIF